MIGKPKSQSSHLSSRVYIRSLRPQTEDIGSSPEFKREVPREASICSLHGNQYRSGKNVISISPNSVSRTPRDHSITAWSLQPGWDESRAHLHVRSRSAALSGQEEEPPSPYAENSRIGSTTKRNDRPGASLIYPCLIVLGVGMWRAV